VKRGAWISAGVALLVGLLATWMFSSMERVQERVWIGYRGEARDNPWLAAERLLERMGRPSARARSVPQLKALPADGMLVLPRRVSSIDRVEQLRLLEWVEGGGHLVLEAEAPGQPDPILEAAEVGRRAVTTVPRKRSPKPPPPPPQSKETEAGGGGGGSAEAAATPKRPDGTVVARLPGAKAALTVQMGLWRTLEPKAALFTLSDRDTTWMAHLQRGAGRITVLGELGFAQNGGIGQHDHAEFLWQLASLSPGRGAVTFFHSPAKLSLLDWLLQHAAAALGAAAALLALWLWRVVPRFGPIAPDPEPARKRLLDHLRASGRFQWAAGGGPVLAEAAREAALRALQRAQPDFAALNAAEREARLAAQFGLPPQAARLLLQPVRAATPPELVAATAVYQSIHEQLSLAKERR